MNYSYNSLGIAMVKNEADIIEAFVRHNIAYLDVLVVIENGSVDNTRDILLELQSEGLPIVIFDDPIVGYFQAEKVTFAYRKVVPVFQPRFVFLLDADEFIVARSREHLQTQLQRLSPGTQGRYFWRTYVPSPTDQSQASTGDPLHDIVYRRHTERQWPKSIIATDDAIDAKITIQQGGHDVWLEKKPLPTVQLDGVALAHFPVRSVEQLTNKALLGWVAYMVRNRAHPMQGAGFQWRLLYEKIVRGDGLVAQQLTEQALCYAQDQDDAASWPDDVVYDPLTPQYSALTVQAQRVPSTLQMFVRSTESLLSSSSDLSMDFLHAAQDNDNGSLLAKGQAILEKAVHALTDKPVVTTAFSALWHQENLYLDVPPFRHIAERYHPVSVLDLGCGSGAYLKFFSAQGSQHILGVDGFRMRSGYLQPDEYLQYDLGKSLHLDKQFSLVLCVEVIEHLPATAEQTLLDNIVRHASERIVFSAARPGQPGIGHINCRPIDHWLKQFAARGWYVNAIDTLAMRSLATFSWFRSNTVVLTRTGDRQEAMQYVLAELEKRPARWDAESISIITHPFASLERDLLAAMSHDAHRRI